MDGYRSILWAKLGSLGDKRLWDQASSRPPCDSFLSTLLASCPVHQDRTGIRQVTVSLSKLSKNIQLLPFATLTTPSVPLSQPVFIDSGVD